MKCSDCRYWFVNESWANRWTAWSEAKGNGNIPQNTAEPLVMGQCRYNAPTAGEYIEYPGENGRLNYYDAVHPSTPFNHECGRFEKKPAIMPDKEMEK